MLIDIQYSGVTKLDTSQRVTDFQQKLRDLPYTILAGTSSDLAQSPLQNETQPRLAETGAVLLFNIQNNNASEAVFLAHWHFMNSKAWMQNLNYYKQRQKDVQRGTEDTEAGGKID